MTDLDTPMLDHLAEAFDLEPEERYRVVGRGDELDALRRANLRLARENDLLRAAARHFGFVEF